MTPSSTLEYGYATGRADTPTRLVPADEPEARQSSLPQQEGLQAEKVIKGLFTGTFNFDVHIIAAANRSPLVITGSLSIATNSADTGPFFGLDITITRTTGNLTLFRGTIQPSSSTGDNFLLFRSATTTRWKLNGEGQMLMRDSSAGFPTLTFINETNSGIYRLAGIPGRWFLESSGLTDLEIETVAAVPGDGVRRIRVYGTGNSVSQPQVTHGGGFNNSQTGGIWWSEAVIGNPRVAIVNNGAAGISIGQPTQSAAAAFRTHVELSGASLTAALNNSAALVRIGGQQVRSSGGAHPQFNTLQIDVVDDGPANAGLLTDSTTLYIGGSPDTDTAGKVSNFRAIWVRYTTGGGGGISGGSGGLVDIEGDLEVKGQISFGRGGLGQSIRAVRFGNGLNIVKAGSGNHPVLSLLELEVFSANGVATHTDATTLRIVGAPSSAGTGKLRALHVVGGEVEFAGLLTVANTFTAAAGVSAALSNFSGTLTEAGAGNHPRLSLIEFAALGVTAGAATVADATTVYIAGAPAGVVTGKNRALWVVAGETELGGILTVAGAATFAVVVTITTGGLTVTAGGILVTAGGCDVTGTLFVRTDRGLDLRGQTDQAGVALGTLTNAPAAGDPAIWVPIVVNGANRAFPAW